MPEARVVLRWPDGVEETLWSPSLVVHDHLEAGTAYPVAELVARTDAAMAEADRRVRDRYGIGCTGAEATARAVRARAAELGDAAGDVRVILVEPPLPPSPPAPAPGTGS